MAEAIVGHIEVRLARAHSAEIDRSLGSDGDFYDNNTGLDGVMVQIKNLEAKTKKLDAGLAILAKIENLESLMERAVLTFELPSGESYTYCR